MAYVVNEKCVKCKYTDCVDVCPVDCFVELDEMLVIDPETCIDCGLCVEACPVGAIKSDVDPESFSWIAYNKKNIAQGRPISASKAPMVDAENFSQTPNKRQFLKDFEEKIK